MPDTLYPSPDSLEPGEAPPAPLQREIGQENLSPALSHRALLRLSSAAVAHEVPAEAASDDPKPGRPKRRRGRVPTRRQRLDAEAAREWRERKWALLDAVRELRSDVEPSVQSPDLTRAVLFAPPRPSDVPDPPREKGRPRDDEDRSEEAEAWRRAWREYDRAAAWRAEVLASGRRRWKPYGTWGGKGIVTDGSTTIGRHAERGGKRAGEEAWPAAWTAYLLRHDPAGVYAEAGDGWGSVLGRALKAVERDYAATRNVLTGALEPTPLWTVLWLFTDPRSPQTPAQIAAQIGGSERRVYRWLEAAARRLWAEIERIAKGSRKRSWREQREAEQAEAEAWQAEAATTGEDKCGMS